MDQQAVDESWMQKALDIARGGERQGEVPVGAIVVRDGELSRSTTRRRMPKCARCARRRGALAITA